MWAHAGNFSGDLNIILWCFLVCLIKRKWISTANKYQSACFSWSSLVAGWVAAAWLWPSVCLQEVLLESRVAPLCHRPFKGNVFTKHIYILVTCSHIIIKYYFLRELLPAGGIIAISSITLNPTSSSRILISTCWTCLYSATTSQWRQVAQGWLIWSGIYLVWPLNACSHWLCVLICNSLALKRSKICPTIINTSTSFWVCVFF